MGRVNPPANAGGSPLAQVVLTKKDRPAGRSKTCITKEI